MQQSPPPPIHSCTSERYGWSSQDGFHTSMCLVSGLSRYPIGPRELAIAA